MLSYRYSNFNANYILIKNYILNLLPNFLNSSKWIPLFFSVCPTGGSKQATGTNIWQHSFLSHSFITTVLHLQSSLGEIKMSNSTVKPRKFLVPVAFWVGGDHTFMEVWNRMMGSLELSITHTLMGWLVERAVTQHAVL